MVSSNLKKKLISIIKGLPSGTPFVFTQKALASYGLPLTINEVRALGKYAHKNLCPRLLIKDTEGKVYDNKTSNNLRHYFVK